MIEQLLKNKNAKEKANIKGLEIAKLISIPKTLRNNYYIEVAEMKAIEDGVEMFVRAWDKNDNPIGFGKDGSIEIERFRIINPPVLISDPNGSIVRTWIEKDIVTGVEVTKTRTLREDPTATILSIIADVAKVHGKSGENIIIGKIGSTETIVFPDTGTGSTTVDGHIEHDASVSWANTHDAATASNEPNESLVSMEVYSQFVSGSRYIIGRGFLLFDTSSIPDGDDINSAVIDLFVIQADNPDDDAQDYINIYTTTPAADNDLVKGDYDQIGTTEQATSIDIANLTTSAYNSFVLNSTGLGNISKTGVTKFGAREGHDVESIPIVTSKNVMIARSVDQTGTNEDPKLVVQHSTIQIRSPGMMFTGGLSIN